MSDRTARISKARKLKTVRAALRNTTGAIDLASIMVGVLVIGVIGGVIAATVFSVIPWSQNEAAKSALGSVRTAESVAFAGIKDDAVKGFQTFPELVGSKLIQPSTTVGVATSVPRDCYIAIARSSTGDLFYSTNTGPAVSPYVIGSTTTPSCDVTTKGTDGTVGGPGSTPSQKVTDDLATGLLPTTGGGANPSSGGVGGTASDLTADGAPHTTAARMVSTWNNNATASSPRQSGAPDGEVSAKKSSPAPAPRSPAPKQHRPARPSHLFM